MPHKWKINGEIESNQVKANITDSGKKIGELLCWCEDNDTYLVGRIELIGESKDNFIKNEVIQLSL
jgi:hypothetical protein